MLACCESLLREKLRLQQALDEERQRRRRVTMAFKNLLQAYHSVVEMNDFLNLSTISSDVNEKKIRRSSSSSNGSGSGKENRCNTPTFPPPKIPPPSVPTVKTSDFSSNYTNKEDLNLYIAEKPSTLPSCRIHSKIGVHSSSTVNVSNDTNLSTVKKPPILKSRICLFSNSSTERTSSVMPTEALERVEMTELRPTSTENFVNLSVNRDDSIGLTAESSAITKETRDSIEVVEMVESNPSRTRSFLKCLRGTTLTESIQSTLAIPQREPITAAGREIFSEHTNYRFSNVPRQSSQWYFLPLADQDGAPYKHEGLVRWLRNSDRRQRQIAETSQRRAEIAATRRTTVVDLLCGRRVLDEEAMRILHTDSSTISSFPPKVMRQMRSESKKKYLESKMRLDREMGNPREKRLQMATNKILAHTSATITKMNLEAR